MRKSFEADLYLIGNAVKFVIFSVSVYFFRSSQSFKDESEQFRFSDEDWDQLNKLIGYKEGDDGQSVIFNEKMDALHTYLEVHMQHNASKLVEDHKCLAELSCDGFDCSIKLYPETKVFDMKLGSYQLSSPNGLLAQVGVLLVTKP